MFMKTIRGTKKSQQSVSIELLLWPISLLLIEAVTDTCLELEKQLEEKSN